MIDRNVKRNLDILDGGIIFLIAVTLLLIVNLIFSFFLPADFINKPSYFYLVGIAELVAIGIPPIVYLLIRKISIKNIFGKKLTKEQMVLCLFIAVFGYPILGFVRYIWVLLLQTLKIPIFESPVPAISTIPIFLVAVAAVSLIPGISEEIVFRGIIQNTFQKRHKIKKTILLSSVFFMLMHGDLSAMTYTFTAGIVLGILYYYTGSLWAAIIYHVTNNFMGIAVSALFSQLGYDEIMQNQYELMPQAMEAFLSVLALLIISIVSFGICFLLFWALKKVTKKEEIIILETIPVNKVVYMPYIAGGLLMLIIALLPVAVKMIFG